MDSQSPAERLVGITLEGGWKVIKRFERAPEATGGNNSLGYVVQAPDGKQGFLKAIDLASSNRYHDPPTVLNEMLSAFLHERNICVACRDQRMRRVAAAIAHGQAQIEKGTDGMVPYIIFELAEGDIRHAIDKATYFDAAWAFRTLHNVAAGLSQLHRSGIAHLDMKPSNALIYTGAGAKVSDLGRSVRRGIPSPHDNDPMVGDPSYAPPEQHYDFVLPDWNERRLGCDLWLLGSLAVFLFARVSMISLLSFEMDGSHHWRQWRGKYDDVMPYLREGFNRAIAHFQTLVGQVVLKQMREPLLVIVRQLCDPDPRQRGHPLNSSQSGMSRYSVERYVSQFDSLARRCEIGL